MWLGLPQVRWASYMAAYSCQSKCPKEHGGNLIVFVHLASEVPYCHCFVKKLTTLPSFKVGDTDHSPQWEECWNIFSPFKITTGFIASRRESPLSPLSWIPFPRLITKVLQLPLKLFRLCKGLFSLSEILNLIWCH